MSIKNIMEENMGTPEWLNPNNWSPETKAAAKEVVRVAVIFVVTLVSANMGGKEICNAVVRKLPDR